MNPGGGIVLQDEPNSLRDSNTAISGPESTETLFQDGYYEFYAAYNKRALADFKNFKLPWILPYLPTNKDARILDVGCGPGLLLGYLVRLGYANAIGIDISCAQITAAAAYGLRDRAILADVFDYAAQKGTIWDVIVCNDVIEHISLDKLLTLPSLFAKSLRPGGIVIIRTCNADCPIATRGRYIDLTHTIAFTEYSLRQLMRGFDGRIIDQNVGKPLRHRAIFCVRDWLWRSVYRVYESKPPNSGNAALAMVFTVKEQNGSATNLKQYPARRAF